MRALRWLLAFFLFCIALRWGSFFISVINHDESTYIVIADELLRGEVYLRDAIDTKPIGIFLIYAALIKLTGGSIIALRVAASAVVALGAWALYFAGKRATGDERVGLAAGFIYCFANAIFTYYGLSPNTEIYFNVLTIAAVALAVAPRIRDGGADPFWHWPVAGLLLGLAMVIKPFAAAESLAIGLFMLWYYRLNIARMLLAGTTLVGAFALPLLALFWYYHQADMLATFMFYTFEVSGAYPIELAWYLRLKYMGDYLLRYSPFVILGAGALVQWRRNKSKEGQRWLWYLLLQFLTVTTVVLLTGKRFGHYQIQLHPIMALFGACWWASGMTVFATLRTDFWRKWAIPLLIVPAIGLGTAHFFHYQKKIDQARIIADGLNRILKPGETFFAINGWQVAYHLTDRPVPTPYVHSSLLYLDHHVRAFQIDELTEAERILADDTVQYLVGRKKDREANTPLTKRLLEEFAFSEELETGVVVWKRTPASE